MVAWRRCAAIFAVGLVVAVECGCAETPVPVAASETTSLVDVEPGEGDFADCFLSAAAAVAPMPFYAPKRLPAGVDLAEEWWPATHLDAPDQYGGPPLDNPCITGGEVGQPEVQVLLKAPGGWLMMLQNHRADLGDVEGRLVGTVAGHEAFLYPVNGGIVVRWSDGGRWYGLFGRGVDEDVVTGLAMSMQVVPVDIGP